jgi:Copine/C2 domain
MEAVPLVTGGALRETLELNITCNNLRDSDITSKSDPFVRLDVEIRGRSRTLLGETEVQRDSLNPVFKKGLTVDYYFECQQTVYAKVLDFDDDGAHELLGESQFTLAQLLMAPPTGLSLNLTNKWNKPSKITIKYNRFASSNCSYFFKVKATDVKDIEFFSKSDPFLRIYRPAATDELTTNGDLITENSWIQIHETEYYQDNLNPNFKPFTVAGPIFNKGNPGMLNKWEIWDHSNRGKHEWISKGYISVAQIIGGKRSLETLDAKKKFSGNIHIETFNQVKSFPITSYLKVGLNLNLSIAVDFTGSNGIAKQPSSLHYMGSGQNQYQTAIYQVGSIIMDYDNDKLIPAFGFGAKLPATNNTNFCFPLNLNVQNPYLQSYQGVLDAYKWVTPQLEFSGPTNFAPIIRECIASVQKGFATNKMVYSILMIMTDGLITDFNDTVTEIIKASKLPMSLIIIGVGNEDFSQMDALDADTQPLRDHQGNVSSRDCVQFVPFRQFANNPPALAESVLRELPKQIDSFYQSIGIVPTD